MALITEINTFSQRLEYKDEHESFSWFSVILFQINGFIPLSLL